MKMYETGGYWRRRSDMLYYQYFRFIVRCIGADARSMIDVGSGNAPYLEWFDWIPREISVDLEVPYRSETVEGIAGNIQTCASTRPSTSAAACRCSNTCPSPRPSPGG